MLLFYTFYLCFQGQEIVAEQSLDLAAKEGHWVILQVNNLSWKIVAALGVWTGHCFSQQSVQIIVLLSLCTAAPSPRLSK